MDEKDKIAINGRKLQENQENILKAGFHRELAKWHWALFQAYISAGFASVEALELLKAHIGNK
jgi:hypothetical protein